jgi:hypothetical protein
MESYLGIRPERDRALVSDSKFRPDDINDARRRASEVDDEVSEAPGGDREKSGAARRVWWEMVEDAPNSVRQSNLGSIRIQP